MELSVNWLRHHFLTTASRLHLLLPPLSLLKGRGLRCRVPNLNSFFVPT